MKFLSIILLPITSIYTLITTVRNKLFDYGIFKSTKSAVFTINVGNLRVGGTGKTPVSAWLLTNINFAKKAYLSRGYGRKIKGFFKITSESTTAEVGDESKMLFNLFENHFLFAVCENRNLGVSKILELNPEIDLIILDDAYQHRSIQPDINMMLTTWEMPFFNDKVLPSGRLREKKTGAARADVILVTKCPELISEIEKKEFLTKIKKYSQAEVFFLRFSNTVPINQSNKKLMAGSEIGIISALALNEAFQNQLSIDYKLVAKFQKQDHYRFSRKEIEKLFTENPGLPWVTTRKDFVKIKELLNMEELNLIYVTDQEVSFNEAKDKFIGLVKKAYNSQLVITK